MPSTQREPGTVAGTVDLVIDETPRTLAEIVKLARREERRLISTSSILKALRRGVEAGTVARTPEGLYHEPQDALSPSNFAGVPLWDGWPAPRENT